MEKYGKRVASGETALSDEEIKRIKKTKLASDLKGVIRKIEGLIELVVLCLIYYVIWKFNYRGNTNPLFFGNGKYVLILVYGFLMLILFNMCDGFKYGHRKLSEVIVSQWVSIVLVNFVTYFQLCLIGNQMLNVLPILALTGIDVCVAIVMPYIFSAIYHQMYVPKDMLMIYGNEKAVDLKFKMDERPDKYVITKVLSYEIGYGAIRDEIKKHDAVIINDVPAEVRNDILKYCYKHEVRTYVVPKISDIIQRGGEEINLFDTPLYLIKGRGLNPAQMFFKRAFDIFLCLIALIPGLPIMAVVAIAIKCEDHGPVFYRQARVTKGGRVFNILKFRSMVVDAEKDGKPHPATENDPRITKVGKVIRATRIDELPQILNILKSDMSWVGPRPERTEHVEFYQKEIPEFAFRSKVKGGLTGYAQIYGRYNTTAYDKLRLDLMYIENYSFFLDLKLIIMTVQIMLKRESTEGFDKVEELEKKRQELIINEAAATVVKEKNGT
ncbi:MAG: sugar transferase [Lachnospiraceae bacterium]|nr:sugar transferase [Lachnospiraceae bacterium]